jgi:hypothetical protein
MLVIIELEGKHMNMEVFVYSFHFMACIIS